DFAEKLDRATSGKFQLSTDGFSPYRASMRETFRGKASYGQIVKVYAKTNDIGPGSRYSPGEVLNTYKVVLLGRPNEKRICTSHCERLNLQLRMSMRRFTRLTNGHSKKWENHEAAIALFFAYYNWCRVHQALKTTPAVANQITDHVWSVAELLKAIG